MPKTDREVQASQSSVKISINAKGQYSGEVKAYADTVEEAFILAEEQANKLETKINGKNGL